MFEKFFCKHKFTHIEGNSLVCNACGDAHQLSAAFTTSSGVYTRIEQRIEDERRYNSLIKLAEEYQQDKEYNRGD